MKRSPSMERAVPILTDIIISPEENSDEAEQISSPTTPHFQNSLTPERNPSSSNLTYSISSSSLLSPRSEVSYDFSFLNDSPGIRLVSSTEEFPAEVEWAQLVPVMTNCCEEKTDSLIKDALNTSKSVEDFGEGSPAQNICRVPQRSRSTGALTCENKVTAVSGVCSMDESLGTIGTETEGNANILQYKLIEESSFTSPELPRSSSLPRVGDCEHRAVNDIFSTDTSPNLDAKSSDSPISMDRVFEYVDRSSRSQPDLPAISEESEHDVLPRDQQNSAQIPPSALFESTEVPEPSDIAPGTIKTTLSDIELCYNTENSPSSLPSVIHRRVVSDNHIDYNLRRTSELDDIPGSNDRENYVDEVSIRENAGRTSSSTSSRCQSQMILEQLSMEAESSAINRSISTSDPALNSELSENAECTDVPVAPPPVVLSRKNSSAQPGSWQRFMSPAGYAPHNVVTPTTANLGSSRSVTRTNTVVDSKPDRSRVEKKPKEKGDTFSIGTWLAGGKTLNLKGKKNRERTSLDNVFNGYAAKAGCPPVSASLPVRRSTNPDGRPAIPAFTDDLPDNISRVFTSEELNGSVVEKVDASSNISIFDNPKWNRLNLFAEEDYLTWHDKYRHDKLNPKVVRKQDAIYELILFEKQHCANLAFLQQNYRARLLADNILTVSEVNRLIPDVIDALLLFHCNLLEQLLERQKESDEIDTVSDILAKELSEDGTHSLVCINAYTTFGNSKEKSEHAFHLLKTKNSRFAEFVKQCENDRMYRKFEFKSLMTKVIGRPTKYGLLIEGIAKYENNGFPTEMTKNALQAAKRFALRIDNNLMVAQLARRWDDVRIHTDGSSWTHIYIQDKSLPSGMLKLRWTFNDVCSCVGENGRKLMCLGEVMLKVPQSGGNYKLQDVFLVLFDDVLVCLARKTTRYSFAMQEQAVLPVSSLILRTAGRGQSIMIASAVKPTLLEFEFINKRDMNKWTKMLENAISAPAAVRLSARNEGEAAYQISLVQEVEEKRNREAEEQWFQKLHQLFADRKQQENAFSDYFQSRMKFVDEVRKHLSSLPLRDRPEVLDRVREAVRGKFRELRLVRTVPISKLLDDVTRAREAELWSYFDDRADLGEILDSDEYSSDSSGSGRGARPRRIKTFNGAPSTSSTKDKSSIRRHTTVPRMGGASEDVSLSTQQLAEGPSEVEQIDELVHKLPLDQPLPARRECRQLIKHLGRLKSENMLLRNELALDKLRISTLERTRTVLPSTISHGDTMEALRKKEKEVREDEARRRSELEDFEKELLERSASLSQERLEWEKERERERLELQRSEAELASKWAALKEVEEGRGESLVSRSRGSLGTPTRSGYFDTKIQPAVQELSPALMNLTVKSETKRKK